MLPTAGIQPHHSRCHHDVQLNCPDPVGVVNGKVDKDLRRGLDGEFQKCSVLDDATMNVVDQMDPQRILRWRCPWWRATSPGMARQRQRKTKTNILKLDTM
jgi:hypothetical protein